MSWFKSSPQRRTLDTIDFEWNIFLGFTTLQLINKVHEFMIKMVDPPQFKGRIIFMTMFNDILWWSEDSERECIANSICVSIRKKSSHQDVGHSSDLDQKRSGILLKLTDNTENGTKSMNWWWSNSEKVDNQFSVLRVHCPAERSSAEVVENYQHTSVPMGIRLKLFFAQLLLLFSSDLCDEYKTCQARTERPVLAGQSDPLFVPTKFVVKNTYTFSCTRRFVAKVQSTSGKAITTKSRDQDLYWCRIPDNSWSRTVLNDKRQWWILTIHRVSDMSVSTRYQETTNQLTRLGSREHQNWTRVGSHNLLPAR